MAHEFLPEQLSAFLDGELIPAERAPLERHLSGCPECRAELERLRSASASFRAHARRPAPAGLAQRILDQAGARGAAAAAGGAAGGGASGSGAPSPRLRLALTLAAAVLGLWVAGRVFKPQISGVFNQIMAMVSGAATTVGSGQ